ncbi:MAG: ABC transporter permease [Bacteroidota bacterium]
MSNRTDPPQSLLRFLRWFCPEPLLESIEGDLLEWFDRDVEEVGLRRAKRRMLWNIVRFFRPAILLRHPIIPPTNSMILFSIFRTSLRNLKAHRANSSINALGLIIGISASLIIVSILRFEKSFDRFHSEAEHIYRVVRVSQVEGQEEYRTGTVYPLAPAIEQDMPVVELATSMLYWDWEDLKVVIHAEDVARRKMFSESTGIAMIEPSFFEMFDYRGTDFRWLAGNPKTALKEPFTVVLTETSATKYFGTEDPMGQMITVNNDSEYKITGIVKDLPSNTDFPFKVMLSYATLVHYTKDRRNEWGSVGDNQLYIRTADVTSIEALNAQLHQVHASHTPENLHSFRKYKAQPLSEVHVDGRFGNYNHRVFSIQKMWILGSVGIFLLLTACINYINLSTARATLRSREIGVRKVLGSSRSQLVGQFMIESFLLAIISGFLAMIVAELVSRQFQQLLSTPTEILLVQDPVHWVSLVAILLVVTLLAGFYPALIISGFQPLKALKGMSDQKGNLHIRRVLVVVQFSLTIAFILGTVTVLRQVAYFEEIDLGFDKEAIVNLDLPDNGGALDVFSAELLSHPTIRQVSFSSTLPSGLKRPSSFWDIRRRESEGEALVTEVQQIDSSYLSLYSIELVAGRNFRPSDEDRGIVISETLAKKLGFSSAVDAIGQDAHTGGKLREIIGVTRDFHSKSLKNEIDKISFLYTSEVHWVASVQLASPVGGLTPAATGEALQHIEAAWMTVFPDDAINYRFFDENINAFYAEEHRFASLLKVFTVVLIFIGSLGLYGLISFVVNRRMKEMAIRKTFGASFSHILGLLSSDFIRLMIIAFFVATPTAYYLMRQWLQNFVYHTEMTWWMLTFPLGVVLLLALLIAAGQGIKAAKTNPATILREE